MKSISILITIFILLSLLCCIGAACEPILSTTGDPQVDNQLVASSTQTNYQIGASSLYIYPQGTTVLTYNPLKVKGDNLVYRWVSTDGKFEGTGPTITWISPNQFGTFHIMLTVQNDKGDSETATIDIVVIPPPTTPCPYCPK